MRNIKTIGKKEGKLNQISNLISNTSTLYVEDTDISCGIDQISEVENFFSNLVRVNKNKLTTEQLVFLFFFVIICRHQPYLIEDKFEEEEYIINECTDLEDYIGEEFNFGDPSKKAFDLFSVTYTGLPKDVLNWFLKNCVSHSGFRRNPNSSNEIIVFTISYMDYVENHFDKVLKTFK